ncbi:tail protein X [Lelliottia sp. SL45]|uniref:tail protein X n=1 Tax=Lelliottia sp. SL45 TaxID=2994665 RepID=UPI002276381F|nr:tail protein X [Lelliottia sp. SL45]MCY1699463.1 tail protein X [Lelliottia sp. SL45]
MQYTTKNGERLDIICARHYAAVNNTFETVLYDVNNYDLTSVEVFDAGVTFSLPVVKPSEKKIENSLWD